MANSFLSTIGNNLSCWPDSPGSHHSDCTVVIPTYNEYENIGVLVTEILSHSDFHILIVDDNSPDGTGQIATQLSRESDRVKVLIRPGKKGLGTAYIEGFQQALRDGANFICQMDADFSHAPQDLPLLVDAVATKWDVALGSRYIPGGDTVNWGLFRQILSKGGNRYARTILGLGIKDCTSGFRCYHRKVLENLDLDAIYSNGYSFQIEMLFHALCLNFSVGEIPIKFTERRTGHSKMSKHIVFEAIRIPWQLRFQVNQIKARAKSNPDKSRPA